MPLSTWTALAGAHDQRRAGHRPDGVAEHQPIAAVLGCSDARVSPTTVFDQPSGALFEVRVAGNTTGSAVNASLDYAVAHLGVPLVIVLGHTHCGAIRAAADERRALAARAPGDDWHSPATDDPFGAILEPIRRLLDDDADESTIAERNVMRVAVDLDNYFRQRRRTVTVVGALHDLESGHLHSVTATPSTSRPCRRDHASAAR
jgi:carbonic anhydrase